MANLSGADLVNCRAHGARGAEQTAGQAGNSGKPEDLKGKKIASSSLGSLGDFMYHVIMRKYGLNPDKDVIWLSIGTPPERLQALASGAVDAADLSYPIRRARREDGISRSLGCQREVPYPSMSVVTRRKTVQDDRDTVMRMVRVPRRRHCIFLKTHKEFS